MILSVCLNPCVDHYVTYDATELGNNVKDYTTCFAGKGINVARSAAALSLKSEVFLLVPKSDTDMAKRLFAPEKITPHFVTYDGILRNNFKLIDGAGRHTEYNTKGKVEVSAEKLVGEFHARSAKADIVVMSGSLPVGLPQDTYFRLAGAAPKGAKIILDTTGERLLCGLGAHPYLVKPNLFELEQLLGRSLTSFVAIKEGCLELIEKGAQNVLLSLGAEGAVLTDGHTAYRAYCNRPVLVVNTVGAGDTMIAVACDFIKKGAPLKEILRMSVLGATVKVQQNVPYLTDGDAYKDKQLLSDIVLEELL